MAANFLFEEALNDDDYNNEAGINQSLNPGANNNNNGNQPGAGNNGG